jgi:glycerol-3-phosphate dehydrogenase (NAD(P)+)
MVHGVAVVGGGAWGLALAAAATRTGARVLVHSRRDLQGALPEGAEQTSDFARVGREARIIVFAAPSEVAAKVARELGAHLDGRHFVVHGVRGLAGESMATICDVVRSETPARRLGALGGPTLSDDLLANRPSVIVCGSPFPEVNEAFAQAFRSNTLRVYSTTDLRGLEWASALVGCLLIGVGYAQAVGLSPGLVAAVISRGVQESARLAAAAGGDERTLLGLAGYGDLFASLAQRQRPEVLLGAALAQGKPLAEAVREARLRVEAIDLIPRVVAWAERHEVPAPVFSALARGVLSSRSHEAIVHELMTGPMERNA